MKGRTAMEISMTDMRRAVKYLEDAASLYDTQKGQRNRCRAWVIRQLTAKMQRRIEREEKKQVSEKRTDGQI